MTSIKDDPRVFKKVFDPVRARNDDGTLKGDDPSTPDVNEAWEGGEAPEEKEDTRAPKKRGRPKKSTQKKC